MDKDVPRIGGLTWKQIVDAIQTRPTVEVWPIAGPALGYRSKSAAYDAARKGFIRVLEQGAQAAGAHALVAASLGPRRGTAAAPTQHRLERMQMPTPLRRWASAFSHGTGRFAAQQALAKPISALGSSPTAPATSEGSG